MTADEWFNALTIAADTKALEGALDRLGCTMLRAGSRRVNEILAMFAETGPR